MKRAYVAALLGCLSVCACGDDANDTGTGDIEVTAYGEEYIEEGIPAALVSDGWSLSFSEFEVSVRDIRVAGEALPDPEPVDLSEATDGAGQVLGTLTAPAGSYGDASYVIDGLHVVGSATKGEETKTFDWTFAGAVVYSGCSTTTKVEAGKTATFQITVHADHFLYDSLVSEEPTAAFGAFAAADANGDGVIAKDELEARDIGAFDPGNDDEADDLWSWLGALSRTLGHVDGEGHCSAQPES